MFTLVRAKITTERQHTCRLASSIDLRHIVVAKDNKILGVQTQKNALLDFSNTRLITQLINVKDNKWLIAADGTHL